MIDGFLGAIKPIEVTSHDVVKYLRRLLGFSKIGHLGTLDPKAIGVLPIALGKATRLIEFLSPQDKIYLAKVTLGYSTDTGDLGGKVTGRSDFSRVTREKLLSVLKNFCGLQKQTPPLVSAVHYKGERAYKLARDKKEILLSPRDIYIKSIELLNFQPPEFFIKIECQAGVYIRSLCCDIGKKLKTLAVLSYLERTRSGFFSLNNSYALEEIERRVQKNQLKDLVFLPEDLLSHFSEVVIKSESLRLLNNGVFMKKHNLQFVPDNLECQQKVILKDQKGKLLAIGKVIDKENLQIRPLKVLSVNIVNRES